MVLVVYLGHVLFLSGSSLIFSKKQFFGEIEVLSFQTEEHLREKKVVHTSIVARLIDHPVAGPSTTARGLHVGYSPL